MMNVYQAEQALRQARADEKHRKKLAERERANVLRINREADARNKKHHAAVLAGLKPFLRSGVTVEYDVEGSCVSFSGPGLPNVAFSAEGGDGTTYLSVSGLD